MRNVSSRSLKNLKPIKSKWNNSETVTIRVPRKLKNKILKYGHYLDSEVITPEQQNSFVAVELREIIENVNNKKRGYRVNNASELIKWVKKIIV